MNREIEIPALEAEIEELNRTVARGARAQAVLQTDCLRVDINVYLSDRENELSKGSTWRPGASPDVGAVALGCAYNGGRVDECRNLVNILEIWVEQAQAAKEQLPKTLKKLSEVQRK